MGLRPAWDRAAGMLSWWRGDWRALERSTRPCEAVPPLGPPGPSPPPESLLCQLPPFGLGWAEPAPGVFVRVTRREVGAGHKTEPWEGRLETELTLAGTDLGEIPRNLGEGLGKQSRRGWGR